MIDGGSEMRKQAATRGGWFQKKLDLFLSNIFAEGKKTKSRPTVEAILAGLP